MQLSQYVDQYLMEQRSRGVLDSSIGQFSLQLNKIIGLLQACGIQRAVDVQSQHIDSAFHFLQSADYAGNTIAGHHKTARRFFNWLYERGLILSNPMLGFELPALKDARLPDQPPSEIEVFKLLDELPRRHVMDLRNRTVTELLYSCGLRISEALGLRMTNLNLEQRFVQFTGKGGHERQIPLMSGAYTALQQYLKLRPALLRGPDEGILFLSKRGKELSKRTFQGWLAKHSRRILGDRPMYPHLLRHAIAVHLLRGGADIRHVQAFLGHADLDTTKIYLRLYPAHLRADYDRAMPELV